MCKRRVDSVLSQLKRLISQRSVCVVKSEHFGLHTGLTYRIRRPRS